MHHAPRIGRKKIALIGAGNIGGELAALCAKKELGDVVLFDIPQKADYAKGKALDLEQNGTIIGYDARITGTLMPVRSRFDGDDAVEPDFDIFAHLVCSHMASIHVHERIVHTGPMTRERVEMLISQRATITRENIERRCLVIPTLRFRGENLIALGVEDQCGSLGW